MACSAGQTMPWAAAADIAICGRQCHRGTEQANKLAEQVEAEILALATVRRKQAAKEAREWATAASKSIGHNATKVAVPVRAASASGVKGHLGELTPQRAADNGIAEWSTAWQAMHDDGAADILAAIEAVECTTQREPDIIPPPIDGERVHAVGKRFRGGTGVGRDWLRPRHVVMMSRGATDALTRVLVNVERVKRWPMMLLWRWVKRQVELASLVLLQGPIASGLECGTWIAGASWRAACNGRSSRRHLERALQQRLSMLPWIARWRWLAGMKWHARSLTLSSFMNTLEWLGSQQEPEILGFQWKSSC